MSVLMILLGMVVTVGLFNSGTAYAHAPLAGATQSDAYGSIFGHARSTRVQLMSTLRNNYSYMLTDYTNARGHLSNNVAGYTPGNPFYVDNAPGDPQAPDSGSLRRVLPMKTS